MPYTSNSSLSPQLETLRNSCPSVSKHLILNSRLSWAKIRYIDQRSYDKYQPTLFTYATQLKGAVDEEIGVIQQWTELCAEPESDASDEGANQQAHETFNQLMSKCTTEVEHFRAVLREIETIPETAPAENAKEREEVYKTLFRTEVGLHSSLPIIMALMGALASIEEQNAPLYTDVVSEAEQKAIAQIYNDIEAVLQQVYPDLHQCYNPRKGSVKIEAPEFSKESDERPMSPETKRKSLVLRRSLMGSFSHKSKTSRPEIGDLFSGMSESKDAVTTMFSYDEDVLDVEEVQLPELSNDQSLLDTLEAPQESQQTGVLESATSDLATLPTDADTLAEATECSEADEKPSDKEVLETLHSADLENPLSAPAKNDVGMPSETIVVPQEAAKVEEKETTESVHSCTQINPDSEPGNSNHQADASPETPILSEETAVKTETHLDTSSSTKQQSSVPMEASSDLRRVEDELGRESELVTETLPRQRVDLDEWKEQKKRLCTKGKELCAREQKKSRDAVSRLVQSLDDAILAFNDGSIDRQTFKEQTETAFAEAHQQLDQHRGWSQLLVSVANWLVGILSLGTIPFGRFCLGYEPGLFQPCPTKSCVLLNEVEDALPTMIGPSTGDYY